MSHIQRSLLRFVTFVHYINLVVTKDSVTYNLPCSGFFDFKTQNFKSTFFSFSKSGLYLERGRF